MPDNDIEEDIYTNIYNDDEDSEGNDDFELY